MHSCIKWIGTIAGLLAFVGCATMRDSILTGLGVGAVTGAGMGLAVGSGDPSAPWKGAIIGTAVGGIASYFIHNGLENRDANTRRETLFNLEKYDVSRPAGSESNGSPQVTIAPPSVETECYETQVRGNKLIQSHCESAIVGTPEWVLPEKAKNK